MSVRRLNDLVAASILASIIFPASCSDIVPRGLAA
jgi:hypothetical protein